MSGFSGGEDHGAAMTAKRESLISTSVPAPPSRVADSQRVPFHSKLTIKSLPLSTRYIRRSRTDNVRPSIEKLPTTDDEIFTFPAHRQKLQPVSDTAEKDPHKKVVAQPTPANPRPAADALRGWAAHAAQ